MNSKTFRFSINLSCGCCTDYESVVLEPEEMEGLTQEEIFNKAQDRAEVWLGEDEYFETDGENGYFAYVDHRTED